MAEPKEEIKIIGGALVLFLLVMAWLFGKRDD